VLSQAYAKKIHESLRDCAQSPPQASSDALQDMVRWTEGLSRLRVCVAIGNARNFVAFTASRLDGSMGPASSHLSDAWYHSFMVTHTNTDFTVIKKEGGGCCLRFSAIITGAS